MMAAHPSGFYVWCTEPENGRAKEDRRLLGHTKPAVETGAYPPMDRRYPRRGQARHP